MVNKDSITHHISQQFNAELEDVRSHLLAMGGLVEKQVNDAVSALISLGYKPQEASKAISAIKEKGLSSEDLIRRALKGMI